MPRDPSLTDSAAAPESVCVLRLSAIGDCCHVVPVIRTLQKTWPETPITWVIGRTEHRLMAGLSGVEFITLDKNQGMRGWLDVRRQLRGREFPLLLNLHASMRANLISTAIPARRRIGFDRARARDYQWLFCNERIAAHPRQHVLDGMFGFAEYLGIADRELRWDIPVAAEDKEWAAEMTAHSGPIIVISPCSSQRARNFRNWSVANYVAVICYFAEKYGGKTILTGARTKIEREYADQIVAAAANSVSDLVGGTSLKQLFAVIAAADVVLAPDSGPVHMAIAADTPVIGLYATSNPARTGPCRDPHKLTVNRYPEAVQAEFGKPVDQLRWGQRVRNPNAMRLITVADVTARLDRLFA